MKLHILSMTADAITFNYNLAFEFFLSFHFCLCFSGKEVYMGDTASASVDILFSTYFQGYFEATVPRKIIEQRNNFIFITVLSIHFKRR